MNRQNNLIKKAAFSNGLDQRGKTMDTQNSVRAEKSVPLFNMKSLMMLGTLASASLLWSAKAQAEFYQDVGVANLQSAYGHIAGDLEWGDYDNDGDLDAFVANDGANTVWFNNGSGIFTNSGQTLAAFESWGVALGDVDSDGDLDAYVANWGSTNIIWLNDGTGSFSDSGHVFSAASSIGISLGDLDNDGENTLELRASIPEGFDEASKKVTG